jgi:hypothetical protein
VLPTCLRINRQLHKEFGQHFSLADDCLELGDLILASLEDRRLTKSDLNRYQLAVVANYYKATESFFSLTHLCNAGFTEDAGAIARKLIEVAITLKYLSQDVQGRIDKYWYHGFVQDHFRLRQIKQKGILSDEIREKLEELWPQTEAAYQEGKKHYELNKKGEVHGDYRKNSFGKSLIAMAEECGLAEVWSAYQIYCISTHSSIENIPSFLDFEKLKFKTGFRKEDVPALILQGVEMFLITSDLIIDAFTLDLQDSLKEVKDRFIQVHSVSITDT